MTQIPNSNLVGRHVQRAVAGVVGGIGVWRIVFHVVETMRAFSQRETSVAWPLAAGSGLLFACIASICFIIPALAFWREWRRASWWVAIGTAGYLLAVSSVSWHP
jgi:hypothetical protein